VNSGRGIDDPGYNRPLDSVDVLAYECAGGKQWKQRKSIFFFSVF
jgi:hypothetical protein